MAYIIILKSILAVSQSSNYFTLLLSMCYVRNCQPHKLCLCEPCVTSPTNFNYPFEPVIFKTSFCLSLPLLGYLMLVASQLA